MGFEPDAREAAALNAAQKKFRRWIFCPMLAVPRAAAGGRQILHLTRSPFCSSTLRPRPDKIGEWAYADFFEVVEAKEFSAITLADALAAQGLTRIDWLKCDTQGLDLQIFLSLPVACREQLLAVEFEPGIAEAYEGEDRLADVLSAMAHEPFWLSDLQVGKTPRGRPDLLRRELGAGMVRWCRRLAPGAPAWANARYLREVAALPEKLDRRAHLLAWIFATITHQPGYALTWAEAGARRFGGPLFAEMTESSRRRLRWAMCCGWPGLLWRRLTR
ncbi:MAG TPA: FkbM family methyltransferase [Opitutaceae bacterium]|nr:FkbM family methyltransferase [Opitutaceae bacterium]